MNLDEPSQLRQAIIERLQNVIDPETGADVIRMRLVDDLVVKSDGEVSYIFRPSSPFCPIAVYLVQQIKQAVAEIPGVESQHITVEDFVSAAELTQLINQE